jgi:fatty acid desaturase
MEIPAFLEVMPIRGIPLWLFLMFFVPLLALVLLAVAFVRKNHRTWAFALTAVWLVAGFPGPLLLFMGYAFNPNCCVTPLITVPAWIAAGLVMIWVPMLLMAARARPEQASDRAGSPRPGRRD